MIQFHSYGIRTYIRRQTIAYGSTPCIPQRITGLLVVVSVLFEEGNQADFLEEFSSNLPPNTDQYFTSEDLINIEDLLPNNFEYYTYRGSLTTPPCSQIATWIILKNAVEASEDQIRNIRDIIGNNYRPIQPLNGRIIRSLSF